MKIYKFADIPVAVKTRGTLFGEYCKDYLAENETPKFEIFATDADLAYELEHAEEGQEFSKSYLEYIALYRVFCERVIERGIILMHGSVVEMDGKSYMFSAPSGTGKSTHTKLWREYFGDRAVMINDDKPLLRFIGGEVYVYGTPWDGKHRLSTNRRSKLAGICFLHQAEENSIVRADKEKIISKLLNQAYRPKDAEKMLITLEYIEQIAESVPVYEMGCNISKEAAIMSHKVMSQEEL